MNRTSQIAALLLVFGLAEVFFREYRSADERVVKETPVVVSKSAERKVVTPQKKASISLPESQDAIEGSDVAPIESDECADAADLPIEGRCSTNELMAVLPLWMQQEAAVDSYADVRMVADNQVIRVRGRYAWPNGSRMEVEISDLGEAPSEVLLKSLGYNTELTNKVTDAGFQLRADESDEPSNFEYDYATGEGSLQLVIADRFLVEVKLEFLPQESFDTVLQNQVPIAKLEEMAARERNSR